MNSRSSSTTTVVFQFPHTRETSRPASGHRRPMISIPAHTGNIGRKCRVEREFCHFNSRTHGKHQQCVEHADPRLVSIPAHTGNIVPEAGYTQGIDFNSRTHGKHPSTRPASLHSSFNSRTHGKHIFWIERPFDTMFQFPHTRETLLFSPGLRCNVISIPAHTGNIAAPA